MSKVILYIAESLDGYIALPDGGISWLSEFESGGEDYGYSKFYSGIGAVVMGSKTYEQALGFEKWPYPGMTTYVVTHRKFGKKPDSKVLFYKGDLNKLVKEAKSKTRKDVWLVGGANLIAGFMNEKLIDEYVISVIPVLLKEGIALFNGLKSKKRLVLIGVRRFPNGVVQLRYRHS